MTPEKFAEAVAFNQKEYDAKRLTMEMITQMGMLWQNTHAPLVPDAKIGNATQSSISVSLTPPPFVPGDVWTPWDGPLTKQPKTRAEIYEMFGNPGQGTADPAWERKNIVELHGNTHVERVPEQWYFKVHRLVEPYVREGFRRAGISSKYVVRRIGGYVFRHIRSDPKRALSLHSFGIAWDIDADVNCAKYLDPKNLPVPWSPQWMAIWPKGVDKAFVDAMASCGWSWGGGWRLLDGFVDPMHFEWTGTHPV